MLTSCHADERDSVVKKKPKTCCVWSSSGPLTMGLPRPCAKGHDPNKHAPVCLTREPCFGRTCLRSPVSRKRGKHRSRKIHRFSPPGYNPNKTKAIRDGFYLLHVLLLGEPWGCLCGHLLLSTAHAAGVTASAYPQSFPRDSQLRSSFCAAVCVSHTVLLFWPMWKIWSEHKTN